MLAGQAATCAGARAKSFTLRTKETVVDLGMGMKFSAWTDNGTVPGPVLEVCEGDRVKITMTNDADTSHGLDSHALRTDMMHFGPVGPDGTMTIDKVVDTPGVFMYHCASGPVTDMHIKSGLNGAMIVYPRSQPWRPARELVVVESGVFGEPNVFNGRLEHSPLTLRAGDLVRAYVVNVGPGTSAIHVMGTILDTVRDGSSAVRDGDSVRCDRRTSARHIELRVEN